MEAPEIRDVFRGKMQVLQIIQDLLQPGENSETAGIRIVPIKHIKRYVIVPVPFFIFKISIGHGHFVQVEHHGQVPCVKLFHDPPPFQVLYL